MFAGLISGCNGCEDQPTGTADMGTTPSDMSARQDMRSDMTDSPDQDEADASPDMIASGCDDVVAPCPRGQQCVAGTCEMATCDSLECGAEQRCESISSGGAECVDNTCAASEDCPEELHCGDDGLCIEDICNASASMCGADGALSVCASDGSGFEMPLACPLGCEENAAGAQAACVCRDDWECPTFMRCEAGVCLGSGREAECTLDPVPFAEAQPSLELSWGTQVTTDYPNPYPEFSNVAQTTLVANLDDDNLDGEINEFDFPEIIFVGGKITDPFDGSAPTEPSVLRVLRGGGPERGKTILAVCGEQVWREGDPVEGLSCEANEHTHYRVFGTMAVGDLDADGVPEIVAMLKDSASGGGYVKVRVISPDGEILLDSAPINTASGDVGNLAASIADIDGDGMSEVLVGGYLLSLGKDAGTGDWFVRETFAPAPSTPLGIACVGDFTDDPGQEWFEGMALWRKPAKPDDRASRADCDGSETGESAAWCAGESIAVWDKRGELTTVGNDARSWRGVCAVADVWGASGPPSAPGDLDEVPELVLIGEEELILLDAETGDLLHREDLNPLMGGAGRSLNNGGAPNVDDFDGDGLPEIGSAFSERYIVMDLQPTTASCQAYDADKRPAPSTACTPGSCGEGEFCDTSGEMPVCRCLHNSWSKETEDQSSRRTGSSVFDFNGDGAAEVVYNDECFFRIYDGRDGATLFEQPSEHITNIEYPVVADVDNDGNAEIVFSSTSQGLRCSVRNDLEPMTMMPYSSFYNTGIQVWGDSNDAWVSARRIWNQHAYSVTNIYEDGRVPQAAIDHWANTTQGLLYNTYRSNPRSEGLAPDLVVSDVRVSSPQAGCGAVTTTLEITGRVENRGDLRVGPGVALVVSGEWPDGRRKLLRDGMGDPIVFVNTQSIEPLRSVRFELDYDAIADGEDAPPETLILEVDPDPAIFDGTGIVTQSERECIEENNTTEVPITDEALPDLALVSVSSSINACPDLEVTVEVGNLGSAAVSGVEVSFFAGQPDLGGTFLGSVVRTEALAPGDSATLSTDLDLTSAGLVGYLLSIHALVRPLESVDECNLSNNVLAEEEETFCPAG